MSAPTVTRDTVTGGGPICEVCRVRPAAIVVAVDDTAPFAVCGHCIPRPGEPRTGQPAGEAVDIDPEAVEAAVVMAGGKVRRQYQSAGWHVVEAFAPVMSWIVPAATMVVVPVGAMWAWFSTGSPLALVGTGIGLAVGMTALDAAVSR